jgi:hypothetical protein
VAFRSAKRLEKNHLENKLLLKMWGEKFCFMLDNPTVSSDNN